MERSKSTCFVCLNIVHGGGSCVSVISAHLLQQHDWTTATKSPQIRVSTYYWRFVYVSRCLALLKSSQTREEYLSAVALLAPFDPLVFPHGYSAVDTKDQKNAKAMHWLGEYMRVVKEWCDHSKGHRFLGMKRFF
jgi:hypothetical protein